MDGWWGRSTGRQEQNGKGGADGVGVRQFLNKYGRACKVGTPSGGHFCCMPGCVAITAGNHCELPLRIITPLACLRRDSPAAGIGVMEVLRQKDGAVLPEDATDSSEVSAAAAVAGP